PVFNFLAFRNGIVVSQDNYESIFEQIKSKKLNTGKLKALKSENDDDLSHLKDVVEKVLNGDIALNNAIKMLNNIES
ncbi:unnamed protein product, partial [marine sediment metagenome]